MARLDVLGTAWNGYRFAFGSLRGILRLCWPWLGVGTLLAALGGDLGGTAGLVAAVPFAVGGSILWVAILRIALLAEVPARDGALRVGAREIKTLGLFAAVSLVSAVPFAIRHAVPGPGGLAAAAALVTVGLYLAVRLIPASAAIAIDQPMPSALGPAWRITRGNALRLMATLAIAHLPLQLGAAAAVQAMGPPEATTGPWAAAALLATGLALGLTFFVQVALDAACLGLACRALVPAAPESAPAAAGTGSATP